ncbi:SRPBCC family protein [Mucilaginibacter gilvus]|uniref:SRPBCC domain-containing protein n=1 Tax=Mucilaginibacter gilvus TaxID=2305909 RepID=A0A444MQK0_9SPHI|nr:SRPBCC domain-containing protein [Mucilaginibacter gilvus]RWY53914.1 SRPBCC domain-containing protein [Mucilaginibacter gilvus]
MNDYKKSISVNNSADEVYKALTEHIQDWWSDDFSGAAAQNGDQYNIAFGETKKTFEIADAIPGQQVVWVCLKAYIDMDTLKKKDEWVGTRIIWTIASEATGTTLTMLHEGLNQTIECYDVCEPGWNYFIQSLYTFLATGTGTPYLKKEGTLEWENK